MTRLQRNAILVLAGVILGAGGALHAFWSRQLSHITGDAEWIWVTDDLEKIHDQSALFVAPLHLDGPPSSAVMKVCGDAEYVVYVNRTPAACGWSRPGFRLDLYDIAALLHQGDNVIAVEVRSPSPVGGLLFALDVDGVGQNILVSGRGFMSRSHFALTAHDATDHKVPVLWGRPPLFAWGYPTPLPHPRTLDETLVEDPIRIGASQAREVVGGGWEFDLPRAVFGYLWIEFSGDGAASCAVRNEPEVDIGLAREEAQPIVRLPGQQRWLDPQPELVGKVLVFGVRPPQAVEVWPIPEEFSSTAPGVVIGKNAPVPRTRWTTRIPLE
jgi:hypothetical protein